MREIIVQSKFIEYSSLEDLDGNLHAVFNAAVAMSDGAYAPYSQFFVGAAVLLKNGEMIVGNNQENVAYPSSLCAERVAIYSAGARFPNEEIIAIAVYAKSKNFLVESPVSPCGACRQAMAEYELKQSTDIKMIMGGEDGKIVVSESLKSLLPLVFNQEELKHK